jgi:hypothetical protein
LLRLGLIDVVVLVSSCFRRNVKGGLKVLPVLLYMIYGGFRKVSMVLSMLHNNTLKNNTQKPSDHKERKMDSIQLVLFMCLKERTGFSVVFHKLYKLKLTCYQLRPIAYYIGNR